MFSSSFSMLSRSTRHLANNHIQRWANIRHNNVQRVLSMKLNCGIVGLPNVGKSTLFNALVGSEAAQAANFPFCTIGKSNLDMNLVVNHSNVTWHDPWFIEPNVGLVNVPDNRLNQLGVINKSEKLQHAVVRTSLHIEYVW